jgi:hypothetical protein
MAKCIGAVRFDDGELLFFIWDMVPDIARPRLFRCAHDAELAWDDKQLDAWKEHRWQRDEELNERIAVMPWFGWEDDSVAFTSSADRTAMLITGDLSSPDC